MHCPNCTIDIPDGSKFCLNCGSNLSGLSGDEPHAAVAPPRGAVRDGSESADIPERQAPPAWGASIGDRKTVGGVLDPAALRNVSTLPQVPLSERYEVLSEVGRGGFGIVFRARDKKLDRVVAVKRLLAQQLSGTQRAVTLERFEREARAIAGLNHRHIVQVFDHDQDDEGHYIVMEFVGGGTLAAYLRKHKRLPVDEALDLVKGVCQGLGFAHRRNLVHRDIKPANILLADDEGRLISKIVDFGLARQGGGSEVSISGYGLGTPWYMPPEQRRDAKNVNHTADVYALGKTLYELVTGEIPDNVDPELIPPPPVLSRVILKCLKGNPEDRYFSMEELLADLERVQSGASTAAPVSLPVGQAQAKNVCPTCNTANGDDVKFCEQCGTGLYRSCPECDRENSIHKKFCGSCGTEVEGFALVAGILEKIEQYRQEKRWSRVLKEADLVPAKVQLPKEKGRQSLQGIAKLQEEARGKIAQCEQIQSQADQAYKQQEFETALELATKYRDVDPHNAAINELFNHLPQDIARQKDERAWGQAQSAAARHLQEGEFEPADGALKQYLSRFPKGEFVDRALAEARRVRNAQLKGAMRQVIAEEDAKRLRELIEQYRHELGTDADVEQWSNSLPVWEDDWVWKWAQSKAAQSESLGDLPAAAMTLRQFLTDHESSRHADAARSEWDRLVRMELHRRLDAAVEARDSQQIEQVAADTKRLVGEDPQVESVVTELSNLTAVWDWEATVAAVDASRTDKDPAAAAALYSLHVERHPQSPHAAEAHRRTTKLRRDDLRLRLNAAIKSRNADDAARLVDEWRSQFGNADDIEQVAASLPQRKDDWDWEHTRQAATAVLSEGRQKAQQSGPVPEEHEDFGKAIEIVREYCRSHSQSAHLPVALNEIDRLQRAQMVSRLRCAIENGQFANAYRLSAECIDLQIDAPDVERAMRQIPERIVEELLELSTPNAKELVARNRGRFGDPPGQAIQQLVVHYLENGDDPVPSFSEAIRSAASMLHQRLAKERLDEAMRDSKAHWHKEAGAYVQLRVDSETQQPNNKIYAKIVAELGWESLDQVYLSIKPALERARADRTEFRRCIEEAASCLTSADPKQRCGALRTLKNYRISYPFGGYVSEARRLQELLNSFSGRDALAELIDEKDKAVREAMLYLHAFGVCDARQCPRRAREHLQMARQLRDGFEANDRQHQAIDKKIREIAGDAVADVVDECAREKREFLKAVHLAASRVAIGKRTPAEDFLIAFLKDFPKGVYAPEIHAYIRSHIISLDNFALDPAIPRCVEVCESEIYIELAEHCQRNNEMLRTSEHLAMAEEILKKIPAKNYADKKALQRRIHEAKRKVK